MGVDPDIAMTDQPYVFTNDNSLNAEDPLGLSEYNNETGDNEGGAPLPNYSSPSESIGEEGVAAAGDVASGKDLDPIATNVKIGDHAAGQMSGRGWTDEDIQKTYRNPEKTHKLWDLHTDPPTPATAYVNKDGSYIVVNNESNTVIQISDRNDPGWKKPWNDPKFKRS